MAEHPRKRVATTNNLKQRIIMEENKKQEPTLEVLENKQENCFTPLILMPIDVKIKVESELKRRAESDAELAECLKKESKNFEDCTKYIEGRIFQSLMSVAKDYQGLQKMMTNVEGTSTKVIDKWFSDENVYQLAEYYYKDDSIEREKARKAEIEQKRKEEAKKKQDTKPANTTKPTSKPKTDVKAESKEDTNKPQQLSLF